MGVGGNALELVGERFSINHCIIVCFYHVTYTFREIYILRLFDCQGTPCSRQGQYKKTN